jgi:hypothetical protein
VTSAIDEGSCVACATATACANRATSHELMGI